MTEFLQFMGTLAGFYVLLVIVLGLFAALTMGD